MRIAALIAAGLLGWFTLAVVFAPLLGAAFTGRPLTRADRDKLTWGGLAVLMVVFCFATVAIGTTR